MFWKHSFTLLIDTNIIIRSLLHSHSYKRSIFRIAFSFKRCVLVTILEITDLHISEIFSEIIQLDIESTVVVIRVMVQLLF